MRRSSASGLTRHAQPATAAASMSTGALPDGSNPPQAPAAVVLYLGGAIVKGTLAYALLLPKFFATRHPVMGWFIAADAALDVLAAMNFHPIRDAIFALGNTRNPFHSGQTPREAHMRVVVDGDGNVTYVPEAA